MTNISPYLDAFNDIDSNDHEFLAVAELDGVIVGTMQLTLMRGLSRLGAARAQIEGVRVSRAVRGRRVGEQLVTWALERARDSGCNLAQLTSDKDRVDAHRFYERLGFVASHDGFKLALR